LLTILVFQREYGSVISAKQWLQLIVLLLYQDVLVVRNQTFKVGFG
jgi:hypothetical protein